MQFLTQPPDPRPRPPKLKCPPGAADCHFHIFGPLAKYPFAPDSPYTSADAPIETYNALQETLGLSRGVLINAGGYGRNPQLLLDILKRFPDRYRGVIVPRDDLPVEEIEAMHALGVRGIRLVSHRRGHHFPQILPALAAKVAAFGWHVQFYPHGEDLVEYFDQLIALPNTIVLDHFASVPARLGPNQPAMNAVRKLLDTGRVWVKLSGPMRCSPGDYPYADIVPIAQALVRHAPERMVWASDWPHANMNDRGMPNDGDLLDLLTDWVPDEATRNRILADNAWALYQFEGSR